MIGVELLRDANPLLCDVLTFNQIEDSFSMESTAAPPKRIRRLPAPFLEDEEIVYEVSNISISESTRYNNMSSLPQRLLDLYRDLIICCIS